MNESQMQAVLMNWAMEWKKHQFAIPNVTALYPWEADLVSATKAWLVHEMEIKLNVYDFRADFKKEGKHQDLAHRFVHKSKPMEPKSEFQRRLFEMGSITLVPRCPNYFWYATFGFELPTDDLPPYAGWLRVHWHEWYEQYVVEVEREAPRIHMDKMRESNIHKVNRWLAYKLKNLYLSQYATKPSREDNTELLLDVFLICPDCRQRDNIARLADDQWHCLSCGADFEEPEEVSLHHG